ncbi:MAG: hypothetical protein IPN68_18875 [Bacteroidetes bacterium]|nr:hypothetical protein [Bacteroidota bacterium]
MPGRIVGEYYKLKSVSSIPSGKYEIKIGLFDSCTGKDLPVMLALNNSRRSGDGYYKMGEIIVR